MADTEKGFNLSESCILGMTHCFSVVCISRHRCDRRYLRGMFRRSICGDQYSNQSNKDTAGNAKNTDTKEGNIRKFFSDYKAQYRTQPPCCNNPSNKTDGYSRFAPVQCLQTNKPNNLLFTHTNATHHSKKFSSLGNATVHTARNHQNACNQNQQEQNNRDRKKGLSH